MIDWSEIKKFVTVQLQLKYVIMTSSGVIFLDFNITFSKLLGLLDPSLITEIKTYILGTTIFLMHNCPQ